MGKCFEVDDLAKANLPQFTPYNECAVPWGAQYHGDVQYRGGYLEYRGGVQYHGGCEGNIMSTVGVILSTVGVTQYRGGYHEYHGGVQYHGVLR